jgi:hypothetical protein
MQIASGRPLNLPLLDVLVAMLMQVVGLLSEMFGLGPAMAFLTPEFLIGLLNHLDNLIYILENTINQIYDSATATSLDLALQYARALKNIILECLRRGR